MCWIKLSSHPIVGNYCSAIALLLFSQNVFAYFHSVVFKQLLLENS